MNQSLFQTAHPSILYRHIAMAQIAVAHSLPTLNEPGHCLNFVVSPVVNDATVTFGPPEHVINWSTHYEHPLGGSKLSYYLQSCKSGVNDIQVSQLLGQSSHSPYSQCRYLHLGLCA